MNKRLARIFAAFFLTAVFALNPTAVAYVLQGNSWGEGANVTYSFNTGNTYNVDESSQNPSYNGPTVLLQNVFPAGWEGQLRKAFDVWAEVADITFTEVSDSEDDFNAISSDGDIRIAAHPMDGASSVLAHGYYPPPNGWSAAGDIHFDSAENWWVNPGSGSPGIGEIDLFSVALHELGHALGLGHSADSDAVMYAFYSFNSSQSLHTDDIAGIQATYGENQTGTTPEPATWAIILIALAMMHLYGRKRVRVTCQAGKYGG